MSNQTKTTSWVQIIEAMENHPFELSTTPILSSTDDYDEETIKLSYEQNGYITSITLDFQASVEVLNLPSDKVIDTNSSIFPVTNGIVSLMSTDGTLQDITFYQACDPL